MVYFICLALSASHVPPPLEVKRRVWKKWLLIYSGGKEKKSPRRSDTTFYFLLPSTDNKGKMNCVNTVVAPWVILPRHKGHFSGPEHDDLRLISAQSSDLRLKI